MSMPVDAWKVMRCGKSAAHDDLQPDAPLAAAEPQHDPRNRDAERAGKRRQRYR
jgi:hypothetical protein